MWLISQRTISDISVFCRMKRIESLEQLKKEATYNDKRGMFDFLIMLNSYARSSKGIIYYPDANTFDIRNDIDDSYQEDLTEEQLASETHIINAIQNGAFYKY